MELEEKTFARDLVLCYMRRFELLYIYASSNEVSDRELWGGFSVGVAELALFNV